MADFSGRIAATVGVYGSASTWVFNVMRELTIATYGADRVHAFFSNNVAPVLEDPHAQGRHLVWKLHQPDAAWRQFAARSGPRTVLTIRDPRDAVLSMMERFGMGFDPSCAAILNACRAVVENAARPHIVLRYENHFFNDPATVALLTRHLGLAVPPAEQARIFAAYTTERVRAFGLALHTLPPARIETVGTATEFDTVTHIHRRHIGDQRVGKWRDAFDANQRNLANARFGWSLKVLGYEG